MSDTLDALQVRPGALQVRTPYELVSTDLPGAYTSPALPAGFNPQTASAAALIKQGLLWRRPAAGDAPGVLAAWQRVMSRPWPQSDLIVPELQPQPGRTHLLRGPAKQADGSFTSSNWSGAVLPGSWTGAIGYWVIPSVSRPSEPQGTEGGWNSSSWIGLDGAFGSDDVLQAGIQQRVSASGQASYVAWFEWFAPQRPNSPGYIWQTNITNFPVSPGQTVYCSVQYVSHTAGQVYFANETTGQHFSITLAPPPGATFSGNTAEWIMEAPDGGEPTAALPKFTPVVFTTAIACSASTTGNPDAADTFNVVGDGKTLTSVKLASDEVTIDFIG